MKRKMVDVKLFYFCNSSVEFTCIFKVLPGYVSSVEDHGYLISFGIEDTRAFLPKKNVNQGTVSVYLTRH